MLLPVPGLAFHPHGTWRGVSAEIALALTNAAAASGDALSRASVGLRPRSALVVSSLIRSCAANKSVSVYFHAKRLPARKLAILRRYYLASNKSSWGGYACSYKPRAGGGVCWLRNN